MVLRLLTGAVYALVTIGAALPAFAAQPYPSKTLEFVVHVNPGGGTDVFARLIQEILILLRPPV